MRLLQCHGCDECSGQSADELDNDHLRYLFEQRAEVPNFVVNIDKDVEDPENTTFSRWKDPIWLVDGYFLCHNWGDIKVDDIAIMKMNPCGSLVFINLLPFNEGVWKPATDLRWETVDNPDYEVAFNRDYDCYLDKMLFDE